MEIELQPISVSNASEQEDSLFLSSADGEQVELTSIALNDWLISNLEDGDDTFDETLLSRNGLQNARQVIAFLKTPAGETVRELIVEELIRIADEEEASQKMREEQAERRHLLAYLLLKLAHKHDDQFRQLSEYTEEQIDKLLHQQEAHKSESANDPIELLGLLELAESIERKIDDELNSKLAEQEEINHEFIKIAKYGESIDERYENHLEPGLVELEQFNEKVLACATPHNTINNRIHELESKLDKQTDEISGLIAQNRDQEAMQLLHEHNALHLQVAGLKDMLAVVNNDKKLVDQEGNETKSFKDAAFILNPDQKVIKQDNKFYLVNAANVNSITDLTDGQKKEAEAKFNKHKPEILAVKNVVQENKQAERELYGKRLQAADERSRSLENEISLIKNKLNQLQSTKATINAELQKANPNLQKTQAMQNSKPTVSSNSAIQPERFLTHAHDKELKQAVIKEQVQQMQQTQQAQKNNTSPTPYPTTPKAFT